MFKNEAKKLIEVLEKKYNERLLADIKKVALSKSDYKETVEVEKHLILGKNWTFFLIYQCKCLIVWFWSVN